jgi:CARDB
LRTSGVAGSGGAGLTSSGTLTTGALSLSLSSLTAGTNYTFYIRSNCNPLNSEWVSYIFATSCNALALPYNENFDGIVSPALPLCTSIEEKFDHYKWQTAGGISRSAPNCLYHPYTFQSPFDDWFFTAPLQLSVGKSYRLTFYYRQEASGYSDALEIKIGNNAQGSAMTLSTLYSNTTISNTSYQLATVTFTVPASGIYYLGIHSNIDYYSRGVAVDDINVTEINPDIVITNSSVNNSNAATSEIITASFTIANQGITNAAPHKTYFYLSPDAILTPGANGDIKIGEYIVTSSINPASNSGNLTKQLIIPCTLIAGNYTLFIVADGESIIEEANEINNLVSIPITIYKGAFWNGSVSTAWETAGNWSCNTVPDANTAVIINSGTPVVNANTSIKSLTVKSGVNLNVINGVVFTILQ